MSGHLSSQKPNATLLGALLLISVAMLMFEILQTVTLSLQTIERNAFLVVSMCLLGLGGGGSIATLLSRRITVAPRRVLWICCCAFALAVVGSMLISSWTNELFALIALGVLPYIPVGIFLSVVFQAWPANANTLYSFNLAGSALGCLLIMLLVGVTGDVVASLLSIALLILIASVLLGSQIGKRGVWIPVALALVCAVLLPFEKRLFRFSPAPSKGMTLLCDDERIESDIVWSRWGYLGRLDVVNAGDGIGYFDLGGDHIQELMDGGCRVSYLFASGGNWTKAIDFSSAPEKREVFVGESPHSIAYILTESPDVLNIGFGGGVDIFLALQHGARSVVGVEINPLMVRAGREALRGYFDDFYQDPRVEIEIMDGRTYVRTTGRRFDVISLTAVDTGELLHSNAHVLLENYLYTREAFDDYMRVLKDTGFLYVSRPHVQVLRLIATAVESLRRIGIADPGDHIVVLGQGDTRRTRWRNVLISKSPFTPRQLRIIHDKYGQIAAWLPGVAASDRAFSEFFNAVAHNQERAYLEKQEVDFSPVSDDRPFFYEFSRDRVHSFASSMLIWILLWVAGIAFVLIIVPLLFIRLPGRHRADRLATLLFYFAAIGFGFMFIEICLIQKLVLFLGHPSYSVTVTLFSILIFSGLGSMFARRFDVRALKTPLVVFVPVLLAVIFYGGYMDRALEAFHTGALWMRFVLTALILAPGSFFMGMPFPSMIRTMQSREEQLIPWAWAVNAFTSVAASVLTVFLAIQYGFHQVLYMGGIAYCAAMIVYFLRAFRLGRLKESGA